ncbi:hypothetical protein BD310DRAFT_128735 [Dichomitus squalens]|uniref:Uncharacterized protein n=1 Tax=Dichomitus squalens TaxID=114155 RepID=A0A4Q9PIL1_9APHY|nr:hypothetical protein BD310DRAFT_128735 [Dichomitus squalens]
MLMVQTSRAKVLHTADSRHGYKGKMNLSYSAIESLTDQLSVLDTEVSTVDCACTHHRWPPRADALWSESTRRIFQKHSAASKDSGNVAETIAGSALREIRDKEVECRESYIRTMDRPQSGGSFTYMGCMSGLPYMHTTSCLLCTAHAQSAADGTSPGELRLHLYSAVGRDSEGSSGDAIKSDSVTENCWSYLR